MASFDAYYNWNLENVKPDDVTLTVHSAAATGAYRIFLTITSTRRYVELNELDLTAIPLLTDLNNLVVEKMPTFTTLKDDHRKYTRTTDTYWKEDGYQKV